MVQNQSSNATQVCEQIILTEKAYNIEHQILISEIAIADRMLANRLNLREAYEELHNKLQDYPRALHAILCVVLRTAAYWGLEDIEEARAAREALDEVNRKIALQASALAVLLRQRSDLSNTSGFGSNTYYHICDAIGAASKRNGLFTAYLREPLEELRNRFDLKYWPSIDSLISEIAVDAASASSHASDPLTAVATESRRSSLADFVKALLTAIEQERAHYYGPIPKDFHVTDKTVASLVNSSLDLAADSAVDSSYVKRLRQRVRACPK